MASADDDFADYVSSAAPSPVSTGAASGLFTPSGATPTPQLPVSPWYALWERHSLSDFQTEGLIMLLLAFIIGTHVFGRKKNRQMAVNFIGSILPVLSSEFALVGFDFRGRANTLPPAVPEGTDPILAEQSQPKLDPENLVQELSILEYNSYASGRLNIAKLNTSIYLQRRNSPVAWFGEWLAGFLFDSIPPPRDVVTLTATPPATHTATGTANANAGGKYDNFVFAIVNKSAMRRLRTERYDLSLAKTSDCAAEGANWVGIMSESKEITDTLLTPDVLGPILALGRDYFEALVISDQPTDRPTTVEELETPKRRMELILSPLPTDPEKLRNIVQMFIRLSDTLVAKGRFRETIMKKVKATRDDEIRRIKRKLEEEGKEEREAKKAEERKKERELKLRGMTAEQQRKFLEKEREKEQRRGMKGLTRKA